METRDEILRTMEGAYRKATKKEKAACSTMSWKLSDSNCRGKILMILKVRDFQ